VVRNRVALPDLDARSCEPSRGGPPVPQTSEGRARVSDALEAARADLVARLPIGADPVACAWLLAKRCSPAARH